MVDSSRRKTTTPMDDRYIIGRWREIYTNQHNIAGNSRCERQRHGLLLENTFIKLACSPAASSSNLHPINSCLSTEQFRLA
ncbi:hypothetical protein AVEN_131481-1 [Araneus ventricosus]|uniref:Uncharacterized protein n=1 Tax=Araneus ventricosus TaxID=182803 RepID=A0A4Y2JDX9_ARAVE|nr:hypothetical protein AVEN_131481-1 [Araneus ventricosus]